MEFFALGTILGIVLHKLWVRLVVWHTLREMERAGIDINEILDDAKAVKVVSTLDLRIEADRDQFFFYDAHSRAFLAQGHSYEEIWQKLAPVAQGRTIRVIDGDDDAFERFQKTKPHTEVA